MSGNNTGRARSAVEIAERQVERAKRRRSWALVVRSSLERHEISKRDAAEDAGIRTASMLSRQLDPDDADSLAIADIAGMDTRVVRDCARELARIVSCDLAEMPQEISALGGLRAAARLQQEAAGVVLATATALEDGLITRTEAAPIIGKLNELISVSLAIRAWCETALLEGVASVGGAT